MTLAALIRKRESGKAATAIAAIPATQPKGGAATVARIATVAVANPGTVKPETLLLGRAAQESLPKTLDALCADRQVTAREVFDALAGEDRADWEAGAITGDTLEAFISALEIADTRRRGHQPAHYTQAAHCALCGPVWLWEAGDVLACPWCENRSAGLSIPRPQAVACVDCRHFTPDGINPPGGLGHCVLRDTCTYPGQHCPRYSPQPGHADA